MLFLFFPLLDNSNQLTMGCGASSMEGSTSDPPKVPSAAHRTPQGKQLEFPGTSLLPILHTPNTSSSARRQQGLGENREVSTDESHAALIEVDVDDEPSNVMRVGPGSTSVPSLQQNLLEGSYVAEAPVTEGSYSTLRAERISSCSDTTLTSVADPQLHLCPGLDSEATVRRLSSHQRHPTATMDHDELDRQIRETIALLGNQ